MTNYEMLTTPEEWAHVLVEQAYCESCPHNQEGTCRFDEDVKIGSMHAACYDAAIAWLMEEVTE